MTIKKKIFLSVTVLGAITSFILLILFVYVNKFKTALEENTAMRRPSLIAIAELNTIVATSKYLSFMWKSTEIEDVSDKKLLKEIYTKTYPNNKEHLLELSKLWKSKADVDTLYSIFKAYELARNAQKNLMQDLAKFEDYKDLDSNLLKRMDVDGRLDSIVAICDTVKAKTSKLLENHKRESTINEDELKGSMNNLALIVTGSSFVIIFSVIGLALLLARQVTKPLVKIKNTIVQLSQGELQKSDLERSTDEIGQMVTAVDALVDGLAKTSNFAEGIGRGNYDSDFVPLSQRDVLGNSLIGMRENLKNVAEIEAQRKWATEGIAQFAEILRANTDMDQLCIEIIRNLVKYLRANQGGVFIVNDDGPEPVLELKACYAYDRQKHMEKAIHIGDGLVGQCWLEKDTIFLTDVPKDYINITSGLGLATPTCVIIVPLLYNEEVNGVIEIASFHVLKTYEVEFIEKVAQSIASTLSSVTINHRTARLLTESRELAEQLKSQEEELRQNQEEMQATSEETERRLADAQETIAQLKEENQELKSRLNN